MTTNGKIKMNVIAAVCENMGIGKNNALPWSLPNATELATRTEHIVLKVICYKGFMPKNSIYIDKQNAIVIGRKCWESVPPSMRPFKNRINILLSRSTVASDCPKDVYLCRSMEEVWNLLSKPPLIDVVETVWNIGGSEIYQLGLVSPFFHRLYLTRIYSDFDCDVFFPEINYKTLRQIKLPDVPEEIQEERGIRYRFEIYEKIEDNCCQYDEQNEKSK